jgi:hypothetical protein
MKNIKRQFYLYFSLFILARRRRRAMPTLEVKCTVSNCFFHEKGNICGADKIEINMNNETSKKDRTEFASDFDFQTASEKAAHSTDTCCKTFVPKKDAIHRMRK